MNSGVFLLYFGAEESSKKYNTFSINFKDLNLLFTVLKLDTRLEGTLTNNRVESGIITASYYGTSERHKGDNEGGEG